MLENCIIPGLFDGFLSKILSQKGKIKQMKNTKKNSNKIDKIENLSGPPLLKALFTKVKWAWIWLIARGYLGYEWLKEGLEKLESPDWIGANSGTEVIEFATEAIQKTSGEHPEVLEWYARFLEYIVLPNAGIWGYLVVFGEILVGIALIIGLFVGTAALFGGFMNLNYLLSGSIAINPVMLLLTFILILAWRTAGWWGVGRWVLPALGTPWQPGTIFQNREKI